MSALFAELQNAPNIKEGVRRLLYGALDIHFDAENPGGCLMVLGKANFTKTALKKTINQVVSLRG